MPRTTGGQLVPIPQPLVALQASGAKRLHGHLRCSALIGSTQVQVASYVADDGGHGHSKQHAPDPGHLATHENQDDYDGRVEPHGLARDARHKKGVLHLLDDHKADGDPERLDGLVE